MKKKGFSIILLLFVFLWMPGFTVLADTLPKEYEHDGYTYSIEGFALRVYQFDIDTEENGHDLENNTLTITQESLLKYIEEEFIDEINLTLEDITYSPTYHEEELAEEPITMIDLGVNITKEKIKSLLQDYYSSVTDEKNYYAELVVKYKIKTLPSNYNDYDTADAYRLVMKVSYLANAIQSGLYDNVDAQPTGLNKEFAQTISKFIIRSDEVEYTRDIVESDGICLYSTSAFTKEDEDDDPKYILFTNVSNTSLLARGIENFFEEYGEDENDINLREDEPENPDTGVMAIPDTAMNAPLLYTLGGTTIILVGLAIITKTLKKKTIN